MVLQVLADSRKILHDIDAVAPQLIRRPDAGQHQRLG